MFIENDSDKHTRLTASQSSQISSAPVVSIELSRMRAPQVQALTRTEKRALDELSIQIAKSGVYEIGLATTVDGIYIILNGNRRKAVALANGLTHLRFQLLPAMTMVEANDLFARINAGTRLVNGKDHFRGWAQIPSAVGRAKYLKVMPKRQANLVREMVRIFGEKAAMGYAIGGVAPNVTGRINRLHSFVSGYRTKPYRVNQMGEWIIKHSMTGVVATMLSSGAGSVAAQRIVEFIIRDEPCIFKNSRVMAAD